MRPLFWQVSISFFLILVAIILWQGYQNDKLQKKLQTN